MAKQGKPVDIRHYDVIVAPHITEKSTLVSEANAVVFKVANDASKPQIPEQPQNPEDAEQAKTPAAPKEKIRLFKEWNW